MAGCIQRTITAFCLVVLALRASPVCAQNSQATWVFGDRYMLQWKKDGQISRDPVFSRLTPLRTVEGAAAISDPCSGELLFQSDGLQIWDGGGTLVPGSQGLCSGTSSRQNVVFVPWKGHPGSVILFAALSTSGPGVDPISPGSDCKRTYTYSVLTRSSNGTYTITQKNVPLALERAPYGSEMIAATGTKAGDGYWVLTYDMGSQEVLAYHVDSLGVNHKPVITKTPNLDGQGQMQISPDGRKVAMNTLFATVFDFDNETGQLSNPQEINNIDVNSRFYQQVFKDLGVTFCSGTCFSPDSKLLYLVQQTSRTVQGVVTYLNRILQFDLTQPTFDEVINSVEVVYETANPTKQSGQLTSMMNLGVDERIWINMRSALDVIERPNVRGNGCVYREDVLALPFSSDVAGGTFPTVINSDLVADIGQASCRPPWPELAGDTVCAGECVVLRVQSRNEATSWSWLAPGSQQGNAAGSSVATFCYDQPGIYNVFASVGNEYGANDVSATVVVTAKPRGIIAVDTAVCRGTVVTAVASGGDKYRWLSPQVLANASAPLQSVLVQDSVVTFSVVVTANNGCVDTTHMVVRSTAVDVALLGDSTSCMGEVVTVRAVGAATYQWLTLPAGAVLAGDSATFTPTSDVQITVVGFDAASRCSDTAIRSVRVRPLPNVVAEGDTTVCPVEPVQLSATGASFYHWTPAAGLDNPTSATPVARVSVTTAFVVVGTDSLGCSSQDTVVVRVSSSGSVQLDADTTICGGETLQLVARSTSPNVEWIDLSDGSVVATGENIVLTPSSTVALLARIRSAVCSVMDTIVVSVIEPQVITAGPDTSFCFGGTATLTSSAGEATTWYGVSGELLGSGTYLVQQPAASTTYIATAPCSTPDTVAVIVRTRDRYVVTVGNTTVEVGSDFTVAMDINTDAPDARELRLLYDGRLISIEAIEPGQVLSSTGIGSQHCQTTVSIPNARSARCILSGRTYLAPVASTPITPSLEIGDTCSSISAVAGEITVTGCGINLRGGIVFGAPSITAFYSPNERLLSISTTNTLALPGSLRVTISNLIGEVVHDAEYLLSEGHTTVFVPISQFVLGVYAVQIHSGNTAATQLVAVY